MNLWERAHAYHRFWRYRLRTERDEIRYLLNEPLAGTTILDIGAHRGAFTYWLHKAAGRSGRVVAFEPQPELVQYLHGIKTAFRLQRLDIVGAAVSDRAGVMQLVRPISHWGGGSFHLHADDPGMEAMRVPVVTIDDYIRSTDLPPVSFIKCDVQDHEAYVFRGARRLLETHRPTLLFEYTEQCVKKGDTAAFLADMGYRGYFFYQHKLVSVSELADLRSKIPASYLNYVYRYEKTASKRIAA